MTLTAYEGLDVMQASIKVTNAGDGLSEAINVDPVEYHVGDVVHVVLRTEVARVSYEPIRDTDVLKRVHTLRARSGTIVEESLVRGVLAAQEIAIERAKGVVRLQLDGEEIETNGDEPKPKRSRRPRKPASDG